MVDKMTNIIIKGIFKNDEGRRRVHTLGKFKAQAHITPNGLDIILDDLKKSKQFKEFLENKINGENNGCR